MSNSYLERVQWRAGGAYLPTLAGKSSLLDESRLLLEIYAQTGDVQTACKTLIDNGLPQRSRATRTSIVRVLRERFFRWQPPSWVLQDLVTFAQNSDTFYPAMLLHIARQDLLLYDFVQQVIVRRWYAGETTMIRADVQKFLDAAQDDHPEVNGWSYETREKISQNVLTVLRDCTLLKGAIKKQIVLPIVPPVVAHHLIRLLLDEGIVTDKVALHPDWQIWLWDTPRCQKALDSYLKQEHTL